MLPRRLALNLVAALVVSASLPACTANPDNSGPLPGAEGLVNAAEGALEELASVAFEFRLTGAVPGLQVREVEGVADRGRGPNGSATGEADAQLLTERVRYSFVVEGNTLSLTEQDGTTVRRPVPADYAPARLLDPATGIRQLLAEATNLTTETREELDDIETYRIGGELRHEVVSALLPGVHDDVDVKFWIADGSHRLMRVWVQVPPRKKNEGATQLELALTRHNAVEVRPSDPSAGRR
ncbi:LppX_LprAFG lipoprotein [Saccharomonospora xinjiangensis]|uniref:Lipoprotein LprG n=1 Tax=Saccharomonospora xinjiangensis XJ-54 TaxID=882086 RepID=I0V051_9PSEU|nr:LppX_LprAFG lipoprotein [Saccharomonospora xinjiangensis]EID53504.1 Protein of unknown function (DUF1396) [Saccharomonospora xinjiangensis XJ-54]